MNNPSIRLIVNACTNENVAPGSPNDKARTTYAPLAGASWNIAMAEFLVTLAELPSDTKNRLKTAIVLGMRAGLRSLSGDERKRAHETMSTTIDELFPKAKAEGNTDEAEKTNAAASQK